MQVILGGVDITQIAAGLPRRRISVRDYEGEDGFRREDIERIASSTGIVAMRESDEGLCASDYLTMMAERLMQENGWTGADFDGLVFVSQTPDFVLPATSVRLQDRLGLPKTAVAFDINYGCSGYVYGLYQAALLVSSGSCRRALLLNGDTKRRMLHPKDRACRMVFGDGFAATVAEQGTGSLGFCLHSDGSGYRHVIYEGHGFRKEEPPASAGEGAAEAVHWPGSLFMDGLAVMKFALANVPPLVREALALAGWAPEEVGVYAMHQVNRMILGYIARNLRIPPERMPIAMQETGNTGSASVPLLLSAVHGKLAGEGRLARALLAGFGVGLSWGAVTADLSRTRIHDTWEF